MELTEFQKYCIKCHADTNHMYDEELPYSFHLRMVGDIAFQYKEIWEKVVPVFVTYKEAMNCAYGHDLIEDTRQTYNDVLSNLPYDTEVNKFIANIIYAVTNEKGKNREERANDKYYELIRNTPGAVFIKLCDRIANVKYGKMMGSSMFFKYKKENSSFMISLGLKDKLGGYLEDVYIPMINELENLLKEWKIF